MKTFQQFNCSLSLPDDKWEWIDEAKIPGTIAAAISEEKIIISLLATKAPPNIHIDEKFGNGFEKGFLKNPKLKKNEGKMIDFRGLPCYQLKVLIGENPAIIRIFTSDGIFYNLQIIGNKYPPEERSDFNTILNGFAFIKNPALNQNLSKDATFSKHMGEVAGFCIFSALLVYVIKKRFLNNDKKSLHNSVPPHVS